MVEKMLAGTEVKLNTDYFEFHKENPDIADKLVYTGAVDKYFDYQYGVLEYRAVRFETEKLDMEMIALKENLGFCGGTNFGIARTKTPYVLLLNNDTEVDPHFVEALLAGIKKSDDLFSCGAQMIDFRNHEILDNAGDLYTAMGWAVARGKGRRCSEYGKETDVFSCCGYRARIRGYKNRYIPQAKVYHVGSATTGTRYNEKKVFLAARNTVFVLYKNMPLLQLLLNIPFIFAGILVKTAFFVKKGFWKEYQKGLLEGIRDCTKCEKVPFEMKNMPHYVRIQLELWWNIVQILLKK